MYAVHGQAILELGFIVSLVLCSCYVFLTIQGTNAQINLQKLKNNLCFSPQLLNDGSSLRGHTCNNVMDPLSWLISYTSEPAVTAAILITSDPVISRHAQMDRTPRRRGGTVACGRCVAS